MNIIIPMAGRGKRFEDAGYSFPKPLIDVNNKPIIQMEWNNKNMKQCNVFDFNNIIKLIENINYIPLMIMGEELFIIPKEKKNEFRKFQNPLHSSYKNNKFFNWILHYWIDY